ncbi:hypothetical protein SeMB42_g07044 [Synchytrium endobioticum]|uniref:C3H1-type domain-containing protein n=1 Tax=Synchytrium endobioticum TaxID=286115 RepID=A0A507CBT4_9FUNG|nr:hypothetical protein SeMB42_g07044 [Synchytrium endobioticum]
MMMDVDKEAAAAINIPLGSTEAKALQDIIRDKLVQDGFPSAAVLSEFLLVMLANRKTPTQITQELIDIVGHVPEDFVPWLYKNAITLSATSAQGGPASSTPVTGHQQQRIARATRDSQPNFSRNKRNSQQLDSRIRLLTAAMSDALSTRNNTSSNSSSSNTRNSPASSMSNILSRLGPQNRPNHNNTNGNSSRDYRHNNSHNRNSTSAQSQQGQQRNHPYYRPDPTARTFDSNGNNVQRNMHQQPGVGMEANGMMYANPWYQQNYQMMQEMIRTTIQEQEERQQNNPTPSSHSAIAKVRCLYWPYCNKQDCTFHHPAETCPYFPNCRYMNETCMYIHPTPPLCRFGVQCKNANCEFTHLSPAYFKHASHIRCRYNSGCANPSCRFSHPSRVPVNPEINPAITKCKYEPFCKHSHCPFLHSGPTDSVEDLAGARRNGGFSASSSDYEMAD